MWDYDAKVGEVGEESGKDYDAKVGEVGRKVGRTMMLRWER